MTIPYDERIVNEHRDGYNNMGDWHCRFAGFIMPNGESFDLHGYSTTEHACGWVIPFFKDFIYPHINDKYGFYSKEDRYNILKSWDEKISQKKPTNWMNNSFDTNYKAVIMRLDVVRFLLNCYKSSLSLEEVIGRTLENQGWDGVYLLKEILVQACNYDSVETRQPKTITTSKFNMYESFYDYLLMDFSIHQVPKMIYNESQERYIEVKQSEFFVPDSELRLKDEIQAIKKLVPLSERTNYFRNKLDKNNEWW